MIFSDVVATPVRIGLWVFSGPIGSALGGSKGLRSPCGRWSRSLWSATAMLRPPLYGQTVPVHAAKYIVPRATVSANSASAALLFVVAYFGFTRHRGDRLLAPIALVLAFIANFQRELRLIHLTIRTSVFGFALTLGQISTIVPLLIITDSAAEAVHPVRRGSRSSGSSKSNRLGTCSRY